jgi:hypothetical protein
MHCTAIPSKAHATCLDAATATFRTKRRRHCSRNSRGHSIVWLRTTMHLVCIAYRTDRFGPLRAMETSKRVGWPHVGDRAIGRRLAAPTLPVSQTPVAHTRNAGQIIPKRSDALAKQTSKLLTFVGYLSLFMLCCQMSPKVVTTHWLTALWTCKYRTVLSVPGVHRIFVPRKILTISKLFLACFARERLVVLLAMLTVIRPGQLRSMKFSR